MGCFFSYLFVFLILPSLPAFSGLSLSINSDSVVGSEYLEREPSKLYPSCSSMYSYRPFPMGYQDPSPGLGMPLQGFRHVSFGHYRGGGSVSPILTPFRVPPYPICSAALTCAQSREASWCAQAVPGPLSLHSVRLRECTRVDNPKRV